MAQTLTVPDSRNPALVVGQLCVVGGWEVWLRLRHKKLRLETRRSFSPLGQPNHGARAQARWASAAWVGEALTPWLGEAPSSLG